MRAYFHVDKDKKYFLHIVNNGSGPQKHGMLNTFWDQKLKTLEKVGQAWYGHEKTDYKC